MKMSNISKEDEENAIRVAQGLRNYAEISHALGLYTEEKYAEEGADIIGKLLDMILNVKGCSCETTIGIL